MNSVVCLLERAAARWPERIAVTDEQESLTYRCLLYTSCDDLLCGSLEYGLAYPIDSPYFPYREELAAQLSYFINNQMYVGMHYYTSAYSSAEREAYELQAHLDALCLLYTSRLWEFCCKLQGFCYTIRKNMVQPH